MNELEQAFQAHRSGRVQDAIDGYRRALKTAARWEVWHNLAVLLAQQGQDAEAVQAFESAAAMAPANRTEPLVDLGRLLQQRGQVSAAGRVFETLVQRQPGAETWNLLGTARAAAGLAGVTVELHVRHLSRTACGTRRESGARGGRAGRGGSLASALGICF